MALNDYYENLIAAVNMGKLKIKRRKDKLERDRQKELEAAKKPKVTSKIRSGFKQPPNPFKSVIKPRAGEGNSQNVSMDFHDDSHPAVEEVGISITDEDALQAKPHFGSGSNV